MKREVSEALVKSWRVWGRETRTKVKVGWDKRGLRAQRAGPSGRGQGLCFHLSLHVTCPEDQKEGDRGELNRDLMREGLAGVSR